jgi:hypothetical protein
VQTLASDKFEGRLTGSPARELAGDYLIGELKRMGAKPLPGMTDFRMPFSFTAARRMPARPVYALRTAPCLDGAPRLRSGSSRRDECRRCRSGPLRQSDRRGGVAPVDGTGRGPTRRNFGYDSYQGLDVKDKIVVVLRYVPEDADQKTRGDAWRAMRISLQGTGGAQRGAKGHDRGGRRPPIAERRGELVADEFRHRDLWLGPSWR